MWNMHSAGARERVRVRVRRRPAQQHLSHYTCSTAVAARPATATGYLVWLNACRLTTVEAITDVWWHVFLTGALTV